MVVKSFTLLNYIIDRKEKQEMEIDAFTGLLCDLSLSMVIFVDFHLVEDSRRSCSNAPSRRGITVTSV